MGAGSIEEKIFQRQSHKQALSNSVVDQPDDDEGEVAREPTFSKNDLRELFQFQENTPCQTHDTYKCLRCKDGKQIRKAPALLYNDTSTWNHYGRADFGHIHDDVLRQEAAYDDVSFVFQFCRCVCLKEKLSSLCNDCSEKAGLPMMTDDDLYTSPTMATSTLQCLSSACTRPCALVSPSLPIPVSDPVSRVTMTRFVEASN